MKGGFKGCLKRKFTWENILENCRVKKKYLKSSEINKKTKNCYKKPSIYQWYSEYEVWFLPGKLQSLLFILTPGSRKLYFFPVLLQDHAAKANKHQPVLKSKTISHWCLAGKKSGLLGFE